MVAYYKRQTWLFRAAGALLGILFDVLAYAELLAPQPVFLRGFLIIAPIMIGVIVGRVLAIRWAGAKLGKITALLYRDGDPATFLSAFEPIADGLSPDNVEYYDARTKLAFADEALGRFDRGMKRLEGLDPSRLKMHALGARAAVCSQQMRLALRLKDEERAEALRQELQSLKETASGRAPALAKQLGNCLDLYREWTRVLQGESADLNYLREEIELAANRIHKSEMQLLLAEAESAAGEVETARRLLRQAMDTGKGLYAADQAAKLLTQYS